MHKRPGLFRQHPARVAFKTPFSERIVERPEFRGRVVFLQDVDEFQPPALLTLGGENRTASAAPSGKRSQRPFAYPQLQMVVIP